MYDTFIALVVERVSGCSLGWKFWWFEGLVVLEFFKFFQVWRVMNSKRCYSGSVVIGRVFSQMKVMRELRETSAEILGSLMNGKSETKPGSNLRYRRLLAHILIFSVSKRTADWEAGHWCESFICYRGHSFRVSKSQWCLEFWKEKVAKRNYSDKLRIQISSSDSASVRKGLKEIWMSFTAGLKKHPTPALNTSLHNHEHLQQPPSPPHLQFRSVKMRCARSSRSRNGKKHQAQTVSHQPVWNPVLTSWPPSSQRASTDHWNCAKSLHASNAPPSPPSQINPKLQD